MRLSEAQKQVRESARLLARNVVEPLAKQVDEAGEFPWSHFQTLGEQGYFGLPIPTAYGGGGKDLLSSTLAVEEIAAACGSTSVKLCYIVMYRKSLMYQRFEWIDSSILSNFRAE